MDGHVILYICDNWISQCLITHLINQPEVEHTAPLLLIHWIYIEYMFWWIPIVFIWYINVSTCINIVICGIPINKSTCGSHHWNWDMGIKICLHSQWPLLTSRVIKDWYSKSLALIGNIKVFSVLLPSHKTCPNISIINSPDYIVYVVVPVHTGIFTCSEYSARKVATVHSSDVNDIGRIFLPKNAYLSGYPYLLSTHTNGFSPVSLKPSQ